MRLTFPILLMALAGCRVSTSADAAPNDAGASDLDAGDPDAAPTYPAAHPPVLQVQSYGGATLATPVLVPITFDADPMQAQIDAFVSAIGTSAYWKATTAEYGIGQATMGTPIHIADAAPTAMTDADVVTFVKTRAQNPGPTSPLYLVFLPDTTTLTSSLGVACTNFHGYHDETTTTPGALAEPSTPFAVLPRCPGTGLSLFEKLTASLSHEIVEGVTDPFPTTNPAFVEPDDDHWASDVLPSAELGDLCELDAQSNVHDAELGSQVSRTWSNAAAAAGHDPCVPAPVATYLNAVPAFTDTLTIDSPTGPHATKGIAVKMGASATIEVDVYSDGPTDARWLLKGADSTQIFGEPARITVTFDPPTAINGDHVQMTISRSADGDYGGSILMLETHEGKQSHFSEYFVGN